MKEKNMKTVHKIVIGVVAALGLGLAISSIAQQSHMNGMGMMHGYSQMMGQNSDMKIMRDLMTPAERLTMMDKMIDAKTQEERQQIMTLNHNEMEKRAKEKGITLPKHNLQAISGRMCG